MTNTVEADQKAGVSGAKGQDIAFAIFAIVLGVGGYLGARHLEMGTPARMGPGFIPVSLSFLLGGMGVILLIGALAKSGRPTLQRWSFKNLAIILGSMVAFALMLKPLGLVLSVASVVVISSFAAVDRRWHETVILAVVASLVSATLFVYLLGLNIRVWPI